MATDPRTAFITVQDGPEDLVGSELMIVTPVTFNGMEVHLPKALPGVPEYATVAFAEARANELQPTLFQNLDYRGPVPYQSEGGRVLEFVAAAGTAVASAASGLEAFANHQIASFCPPAKYNEVGSLIELEPTVVVCNKEFTFKKLTDEPLNDRLGKYLPELKQIERPTSETWWVKFRQIQTLAALNRHGISDPVWRPPLQGVKSLVQRLCDREYAGAAAMMLQVFESLSPNWIDKQRALNLPPPPGP